MAKIVLTAQFLSLGGTDVSTYIKKAEVSLEAEVQETTTYGDAGVKTFLPGLKSGELSVEYVNDVAAAALDSILFPMFATNVTFEVRASNAAVGTSNPKYTGTVVVKEYKPIGGGVGDVNSAGVSFPTTGAVSRATA